MGVSTVRTHVLEKTLVLETYIGQITCTFSKTKVAMRAAIAPCTGIVEFTYFMGK